MKLEPVDLDEEHTVDPGIHPPDSGHEDLLFHDVAASGEPLPENRLHP
ncbi:hypothetical protein AB4079_16535 [Leifsonia sp. 2MCAF36]